MEKRIPPGSVRGFTLLELLVVLTIVAILSSIAIPLFSSFRETARVSRSELELRNISTRIGSYFDDHGAWPLSLNDIDMGGAKDAWGNPFVYVNIADGGVPRTDRFLNQLNRNYDLYSVGKDGASALTLGDPTSRDDIILAIDGFYVGRGDTF